MTPVDLALRLGMPSSNVVHDHTWKNVQLSELVCSANTTKPVPLYLPFSLVTLCPWLMRAVKDPKAKVRWDC